MFVRFSAHARKVKLFFLDENNGIEGRIKEQEVNDDRRKLFEGRKEGNGKER